MLGAEAGRCRSRHRHRHHRRRRCGARARKTYRCCLVSGRWGEADGRVCRSGGAGGVAAAGLGPGWERLLTICKFPVWLIKLDICFRCLKLYQAEVDYDRYEACHRVQSMKADPLTRTDVPCSCGLCGRKVNCRVGGTPPMGEGGGFTKQATLAGNHRYSLAELLGSLGAAVAPGGTY
ncbi:hypothetical protein E2C01_033443 [Portunus trituberculatus]|uniref:Uncharacterized protein n=1 Tax=Portunus trituberculatus TaxID=210409 RepID=A0A5B7EYP8_PORTR|nr:hypothetical protein [Portunus trituberculatus]